MTNMLNPSALIPKAVKRVHEIYESPTFMEKLSGSEVKQGSLGDCWLMATLSGLANVEGGLQRICVEYDTSESRSREDVKFIVAMLTLNSIRDRHLRVCLLQR